MAQSRVLRRRKLCMMLLLPFQIRIILSSYDKIKYFLMQESDLSLSCSCSFSPPPPHLKLCGSPSRRHMPLPPTDGSWSITRILPVLNDKLETCNIKCVDLYVQVHTSPQLIKWKYEYRPMSIRLLITKIIIVLSLFGLT